MKYAVFLIYKLENFTSCLSSHRPCDPITASLNDNLGSPANSGHPSEQTVRVDYLIAINHLIGLAHSWPQPGVGIVLYEGKRHLKENQAIYSWSLMSFISSHVSNRTHQADSEHWSCSPCEHRPLDCSPKPLKETRHTRTPRNKS